MRVLCATAVDARERQIIPSRQMCGLSVLATASAQFVKGLLKRNFLSNIDSRAPKPALKLFLLAQRHRAKSTRVKAHAGSRALGPREALAAPQYWIVG